MTKRPPSHRIIRLFSASLIVFGVVAVAVAVLSNQLGLTHGSVSKSRILLGMAGVVFVAAGIFHQRAIETYRSVAIVGLNTVVLAFGLEILAIGINRFVTPKLEVEETGAFREVSETEVERQLYVGWLAKPFTGDFINIDEVGQRRTPPPNNDSDRSVRVFAFGGSTIWGEGVADHETIPAFLQQMLAEKAATSVEVRNFGQRGWVSTQSLFQLMLTLQRGDVPDIVLFYDGCNEVFAAASTGKTSVPENLDGVLNHLSPFQALGAAAMKSETGQLIRNVRSPLPIWPEIDVERLADGIVETYLANLRATRALGREYGFDVRFFWQPQLFTDGKILTEAERTLLDHPWLGGQAKELTTAVYDRIAIAATQEEELVDIHDAFRGTSEQVYFDTCHVNTAGNRRVAEVMLNEGLSELVAAHAETRDTPPESLTQVIRSR